MFIVVSKRECKRIDCNKITTYANFCLQPLAVIDQLQKNYETKALQIASI